MIEKTIKKILAKFAKLILNKYQPKIIGITGSVGKTSAKNAVAAVVSLKFRTRKSEGNFNNELGLPLTIIGVSSPKRSILGWLKVFAKAIYLILIKDKNYPECLVLEMGADHPGDIKYLTSIARPDVGIITRIGESHLEYFKTVDGVKAEKSQLVKNLSPKDFAILNFDDSNIRPLAKDLKASVIGYGSGEYCDVRVVEIDDGIAGNRGLRFKIFYNGATVPVFIPGVLGYPPIYAALAGAATGIAFEMNLVQIATALGDFKPEKGRLRLIPGVKGTTILDDTYNASPQSSIEALTVFKEIKIEPEARRFAVFGNMLELGNYSEEGHRLVGAKVAELRINYLIAVGERARDIARGAEIAGMNPDSIFTFDNTEDAGNFLDDRIKTGDAILIKGSQGARMEKIVKEIMADPLNAENLIVRQTEDWLKK